MGDFRCVSETQDPGTTLALHLADEINGDLAKGVWQRSGRLDSVALR